MIEADPGDTIGYRCRARPGSVHNNAVVGRTFSKVIRVVRQSQYSAYYVSPVSLNELTSLLSIAFPRYSTMILLQPWQEEHQVQFAVRCFLVYSTLSIKAVNVRVESFDVS